MLSLIANIRNLEINKQQFKTFWISKNVPKKQNTLGAIGFKKISFKA